MSRDDMTLPNLFIVGAQKAGTTFLRAICQSLPEVFVPSEVEQNIFARRSATTDEIHAMCRSVYGAGAGRQYRLDKTPAYFWRVTDSPYVEDRPNISRGIPERIAQICGREVRIMVALRDPTRRAVSAFFHHARRGRVGEGATFESEGRKRGIIDMGFYGRHLSPWIEQFGADRVLVLVQESDFEEAPVLQSRIAEFLGLEVPGGSLDIPSSAANAGGRLHLLEDGRLTLQGQRGPHVSVADIERLNQLYEGVPDSLASVGAPGFPDRARDASWGKATLESMAAVKGFPERRPGRAVDQTTRQAPLPESDTPRFEGSEGVVAVVGQSAPRGVLQGRGIGVAKEVRVTRDFVIESPCRPMRAELVHDVGIGAFTYLVTGRLFYCDIGRYCSIARGVEIGQTGHPTDWLSTHPFQYRSSLDFPGGSWQGGDEWQRYDSQLRSPVVASPTVVGHDVWMGNGVFINNGIRIGHGAVVGARSVVTKDVPPYAIVAGVPAKVIAYRFDEDTITDLLEVAWWRFAPWQLQGLDFSKVDRAVETLRGWISGGEVAAFEPSVIASRHQRFDDHRDRLATLV